MNLYRSSVVVCKWAFKGVEGVQKPYKANKSSLMGCSHKLNYILVAVQYEGNVK